MNDRFYKMNKVSLAHSRKMQKKSTAIFAALPLAALLMTTPFNTSWAESVPVNQAIDLEKTDISNGFSHLIKTVEPAVVSIVVTSKAKQRNRSRHYGFGDPSPQMQEFLRRYFGNIPELQERRKHGERSQRRQLRGSGSGFVIDTDGYIVTNYHVVDEADEIEVVFSDGMRLTATLEGKDNKTDLALLKVDTDKELPYAEFGNSDGASVGDWVIAIGNPFGLGGTATSGIISARGRDIQSGQLDDFIQIDAPINRGNSGGPLFNTQGQVIGVNSAIYSPNGGSVGIGFAIPSVMAQNVIEQLKDNGTVERGYLGVQIQSIDESLAEILGLEKAHGALVAEVVSDSPADKAGVKAGDVVIEYNGKTIEKMRELPKLVALTKQGSEAKIKVWRDEKTKTLKVKIGDSENSVVARSEKTSDNLGIVFKAINPDIAREFRIDPETSGVIIVDIEPDSVAAEQGIRPGDIIKRVGKRTVTTPDDVLNSIKKSKKKGKKSALFLIERGQRSRFIALPLEN